MSVTTVIGKKEAKELGICAPHEHVYIDMGVFFTEPEEIGEKNIAYEPVTIEKLGILKRNPFALLDNVMMTDEATQTAEIMKFKEAGGCTIVDATTIGLGRDPALLVRAALATGLNIVAGAGFYVEGAQRQETLEMTIEEIEGQIVAEVEAGIGHSGVKAGIIGEIGISHVMLPFEKKSLHGACRAQVRTGAPLMIHINPWSVCGLDALKVVGQYGINPKKVVICHVDVQIDEDYIFRLLDKGVYVEFDNWGKEMFTDRWNCKPGSGRFATDWQRANFVKRIVDKGYTGQVLHSTDLCLKSLMHRYGGWGYDHILKHIVPMLNEVGVTPQQVDQMLIENPIKWLD